MPSSFECRACKAKVEIPEKLVGNRLKCEKCQTLLTIPGTAAPESPKPKSAPVRQRNKDEDDEEDDDDDLTDRGPVRPDGSRLVLRIVLIGFGGLMLVASCIGGGLYFWLKRSPNQVAVISKPAPGQVVRPGTQQPLPVPKIGPRPNDPPSMTPVPTPTPSKPKWTAFTGAPGMQFDSPYPVVKDTFGAMSGSNWVGKYGKQHGFNPWMTDQFYFTDTTLRVPLPAMPTEADYLKLLEGYREYSIHKAGDLMVKETIALGGMPCLEIRFRQKGAAVKEDVREHNAFFIATDGKRLAIFDFKTFGAPPDEEVVKGVIGSFKFLP
jgi:hypothetical protein